MRFRVLARGGWPPSSARPWCYLRTDNWDDFGYKSLYDLVFVDQNGEQHEVGSVKIGRLGMGDATGRPEVPSEFTTLPPDCFSLGQDDTYYENLNRLGESVRDAILRALRDVALDSALFAQVRREKVTGVSLLRSVSVASVQGQFHRLATGGARLSRFAFGFTPPAPASSTASPSIDFSVEPESSPPTNVHVVIGRNGVGKTRLLHLIAQAVVKGDDPATIGTLVDAYSEESQGFASLVSVSFSAFDEFEPLSVRRNKSAGVQYAYVGLKRIAKSDDQGPTAPKTPVQLSREFVQSVRLCRLGARAARWRRSLEMLETDPIFSDADIATIAPDLGDFSEPPDAEALDGLASEKFKSLSSGHKIVLLTITRLVETVEERSLILLDEPEAHLHPPLLSAFVRALSDLLTNRNGVAIIATHSPVVLQEVPRSCVWKLHRSGSVMSVQRPEIETFGENVGVLTRDVFGLEVTHSGFHRLLAEAIAEKGSFSDAVDRFDGQLGGEARALLRAMAEERRQRRRGGR